ncbi:MAG: pirin family protein [Acidimicrobiales bacterium]
MTTPSPRPFASSRFALGTQWPTVDPFLFVAHHRDAYPAGDARMGPAASLEGRNLGMDFDGRDGWNMYHGSAVPGFPQHPHRGFETVTYVRTGHIDHADSLGATARFGRGDTQWMTAGSGVVHSEMFPLLDRDGPNPLELFQIWLNLPAADKLVDPYFTMLWSEDTPRWRSDDVGTAEVTVVAGSLTAPDGRTLTGGTPPPDSWAARPASDLAIWHAALADGASVVLPSADGPATRRTIYVFDGDALLLTPRNGAGALELAAGEGAEVNATVEVMASARAGRRAECLVLQGRPIGEPVARYGPFVMNDRAGVAAAFEDYQRTGFGGWPWPSDDPVHDREAGRFARHADGRVERRDGATAASVRPDGP